MVGGGASGPRGAHRERPVVAERFTKGAWHLFSAESPVGEHAAEPNDHNGEEVSDDGLGRRRLHRWRRRRRRRRAAGGGRRRRRSRARSVGRRRERHVVLVAASLLVDGAARAAAVAGRDARRLTGTTAFSAVAVIF